MIYVSQSGDGVRFLKKSKAYSGRFYQGDVFRRQELKARGAGEPKRAAQPWAARSQRLRSASRSAPLGDTTSLVDQAQKTAQVVSLGILIPEVCLMVC